MTHPFALVHALEQLHLALDVSRKLAQIWPGLIPDLLAKGIHLQHGLLRKPVLSALGNRALLAKLGACFATSGSVHACGLVCLLHLCLDM